LLTEGASSGILFTMKIAPSILSANFNQLDKEIKLITDGGADYVHLDIMDGHFVPNLTFGPPVAKRLSELTNIPLDVHLMVYHPENYVDLFANYGANVITVHQESTPHLDKVLNQIKSAGAKCAVAVNPGTGVKTLRPVLELLDMVLIMSVNPGFSGQSFIPYALDKVAETKTMIEKCGLDIQIQIDGGVTLDNIAEVSKAGVDISVAGSAVYGKKDVAQAVRDLKDACK
jgi:ribulose-phosphate 3-epimerase